MLSSFLLRMKNQDFVFAILFALLGIYMKWQYPENDLDIFPLMYAFHLFNRSLIFDLKDRIDNLENQIANLTKQ